MGQGPFLSPRKSRDSPQKLKTVSDVCTTPFFASVRAVEIRAQKNRVVASDSQAVPTAPIVYYSSSLRGQAVDSSWHTSNQNDIIPFSMPCYSYFSKLDTLKFRAKFG